MKKIKVAFIFGGCSSEYDVSLMSIDSVIREVDREKYEPILIGITKEGDFYLYEGEIEAIGKDEWFASNTCKKITISSNRMDHGFIILETKEVVYVDIFFPVLHGRNGEDGRLQGLFELAGIPYVGCDMTSSAICMDKYIAHKLVKDGNIEVPESYLFTKYDSILEIISKVKCLNYPIFVKPLKAGSSFGITKVENNKMLKEAIKYAFSYDDKIIIEEGIDGFEVGCAILGEEKLTIGEVDEIELKEGFFDYEEKYTLKTSRIILPARLDVIEREKIKDIALKIYKILGCKGFARIDMFYTKDKKIVFNEVNTIPGFTTHSRYPAMLKMIGMDFKDIISKLIELGMNE